MMTLMPDNIEKGFAPLFVIIALTLVLGTGAAASHIPTTTEYPEQPQNVVLGDEHELSEEEYRNKEEEIKEEWKRKEEELKKKEELRKEELKVKEELLRKEKEKRIEEYKKQEEKKKVEKERSVELKKRIEELRKKVDGEKKVKYEATKSAKVEEEEELKKQLALIEKELKEDDNKIEYEQQIGDLKMKYVYENGKLKVKAKAENGAEIEVEDEEVQLLKGQLEKQLMANGIEIASSSSKVVIGKNKIKAKTNFPVSVDPETNQLMITTPAGSKVVTVLPDQAVQNMLAKKILTEVDFSADSESTDSASESEIELENRNNKVVYKVKGKKEHKLMGLIPIKTDTTAYVSAEDGEVVAKDESLLSKLIGILSF